MQMFPSNRTGDDPEAQAAHLAHELPKDRRADLQAKAHCASGLPLVVRAQPGVLARRGRVPVIARGVNAMSAASKSATVAVQPGATRVDDDVDPATAQTGHARIVAILLRSAKGQSVR